MSRLPQVTPRKMLAALRRAGFVLARVSGSHHFMEYPGDPSRWATIAMRSDDLDPRDVFEILKQTKLSRAAFLKLL